MNTTQLKELTDWLDAEIKKYTADNLDESDIHDEACLVSFQRVKEKINEIYNSQIYELIPLDKEIADKFISNCLKIGKFHSINGIISSIEHNGFRCTLFEAFDWESSPEKGKYWFYIHNKLQK